MTFTKEGNNMTITIGTVLLFLLYWFSLVGLYMLGECMSHNPAVDDEKTDLQLFKEGNIAIFLLYSYR